VRWFLRAFEDVLDGMHKFPGPAWDVITDIGRMAVTARAR
jgi:ornithine--oxo-acid transaminase